MRVARLWISEYMASAQELATLLVAGVAEGTLLGTLLRACEILGKPEQENISALLPTIPFLVHVLETREWEDVAGVHTMVSTLMWMMATTPESNKALVEGKCVSALFGAMKDDGVLHGVADQHITAGACAALERLFTLYNTDDGSMEACKETFAAQGPEFLVCIMRAYPGSESFRSAASALGNLWYYTEEVGGSGGEALMQRIVRTGLVELAVEAVRQFPPLPGFSPPNDTGGSALGVLEELCSDSTVTDARQRAVRAGALDIEGIEKSAEKGYELYERLAKTDRAAKRQKSGARGWDEGGYAYSDDYDSDGEFNG